jgi:predicted O-methyltransferase YrrM
MTVDGVELVLSWGRPSQSGSLTLLKSTEMVPLYEDLLAVNPHPRMVELGISQGGSVALLALLARPTKLVALELSPTPIEPLAELLAERGLDDAVRPYYGVDQADRARVAEIVDAENGGEPLDIVIDDASHLYEPTLASFEVLFPRLRPGGTYVIEDWTWQDVIAARIAASLTSADSPLHDLLADSITELAEGTRTQEVPVSRLALELALARAHSGQHIVDLHLDEHWITIRRGEGHLDPDTFRLADIYPDSYGLLAR